MNSKIVSASIFFLALIGLGSIFGCSSGADRDSASETMSREPSGAKPTACEERAKKCAIDLGDLQAKLNKTSPIDARYDGLFAQALNKQMQCLELRANCPK